MWGLVFGENNLFHNFKFTFPNTNSDILLHLTHWQYWFWFWFTYLFVLYYLIFLKLIRSRVNKFKPKLSTSFLSHGKWGDILVCLLPISWCTNILSNSNAILRMIEWQTESNVFTLRVRGKQWYWVYKFEVKNYQLLSNLRKSVGLSDWIKSNYNWSLSYMMFLRDNKSIKDNFYTWFTLYYDYEDLFYGESFNTVGFGGDETYKTSNKTLFNKNFFDKNDGYLNLIKKNYKIGSFILDDLFSYKHRWFSISKPKPNLIINPLFCFYKGLTVGTHHEFGDFIVREDKNRAWVNIIDVFIKDFKLDFQFFDNEPSLLKYQPICMFLVIKQKRIIKEAPCLQEPTTLMSEKAMSFLTEIPYNYWPEELRVQVASRSSSVDEKYKDLLDETYKNFRNKFHQQFKLKKIVNSGSNRRLLRTRRILVLPSHLNIGLITNSFDVIHSWYIPGLGVKLDCVPGRSTHHTLYIDHVGFYYGQCAEICGRYHHHMPIRLCAIPVRQFLIWWYNYGSPYFFASLRKRNNTHNKLTDELSW